MVSWEDFLKATFREWVRIFSGATPSEGRVERQLFRFASVGQRLALEGYALQKVCEEVFALFRQWMKEELSLPALPEAEEKVFEQLLLAGMALARGYGEGVAFRLHSLARIDPLTGLYTRRAFERRFLYFLDYAKTGRIPLALAILNVDGMKDINDVYGYPVGDLVLRGIASLLEETGAEVLGRLSGDEFGLVFIRLSREAAFRRVEMLLERIRKLDFLADEELRVTASCGLAFYPEHGESWGGLMAAADSGLIMAKMKGGDRIEVIAPGTSSRIREIHEGSVLVRRALQNPESIVPVFQPIQDMQKATIVGYEVLARVEAGGRLVPASAFISAAERERLIEEIDRVVFAKALRVKKEQCPPGTLFFLNVSMGELERGKIVEDVIRTVEELAIPPFEVLLEITEREAIRDIEALRKAALSLESSGILLTLDDFGSGFSSFSYLQLFDFAYVKIDGSLVRGMRHGEKARLIVKAMVELVREIGAEPIGEFVEDAEMARELAELGVRLVQGYFAGKPGPLPQVSPK
uniref:Bifunctional diguanylate cyclase/phosphodiesterase n=1 Tax=Candidatus Caldatribacterium saccharofermentans TaxID=1454753 RepID=A0A7V4TI40_9BACT